MEIGAACDSGSNDAFRLDREKFLTPLFIIVSAGPFFAAQNQSGFYLCDIIINYKLLRSAMIKYLRRADDRLFRAETLGKTYNKKR